MKTLLIGLAMLISLKGWCKVIYIPADYPTVQQGLNAAAEHDTVLIADGTYYENLIFPPLNLTLASYYLLDGDTLHIANTILDGSRPSNPDSGSVLYMEGNQDSTTLISGLTIQNGTGTLISTLPVTYGGGMIICGASPALTYNRIQLNRAGKGGGIFLGLGANALLYHNQIWNNQAIYYGGGLRADTCAPRVDSNHFDGNVAGYMGGGFYFQNLDSISVTMTNNYIENCQADVSGGGLLGEGIFYFSGNIVTNNTADVAAGVTVASGAQFTVTTATIVNNQFLGNVATSMNGIGALDLNSGVNGLIANNLFQNNIALWGAALNLWDGTYTVINNWFENNSGSSGGIFYVGTFVNLTTSGNTITGSTGSPQCASAIFGYINTPLVIRHNNIYGNTPPAVALSAISPLHTMDADSNWWGDPSGPYHPTLNPNGLGDTVGDGVLFDPWLTSIVVGVPPNPPNQPKEFRLYPPHPNPFNPSTAIRYQLPAISYVNLKVYDTAGRLIATLVNESQPPGTHQVTFNGSALPSGVYLYRFTAGANTATGKMVLLK